MRDIWGYDVRCPGPIRWRWALFLAWLAALGGCRSAPRRQEPEHTAMIPCSRDNCGKRP